MDTVGIRCMVVNSGWSKCEAPSNIARTSNPGTISPRQIGSPGPSYGKYDTLKDRASVTGSNPNTYSARRVDHLLSKICSSGVSDLVDLLALFSVLTIGMW